MEAVWELLFANTGRPRSRHVLLTYTPARGGNVENLSKSANEQPGLTKRRRNHIAR